MNNILGISELNINYIIAQFLCALGVTSLILSYNMHKKTKALIWQMLCNVFYGIHYMILGALSGAFLGFLAVFRGYVYYEYTSHKQKIPVLILMCFCTLAVLLGITSFSDFFSIFPLITTLLNTIGTWHPSLKIYRIFGVIISFCWIIYNIHVMAFIAIIASVFEFIAAIVAIVRIDILKVHTKTKKKSNTSKLNFRFLYALKQLFRKTNEKELKDNE